MLWPTLCRWKRRVATTGVQNRCLPRRARLYFLKGGGASLHAGVVCMSACLHVCTGADGLQYHQFRSEKSCQSVRGWSPFLLGE